MHHLMFLLCIYTIYTPKIYQTSFRGIPVMPKVCYILFNIYMIFSILDIYIYIRIILGK